jgi:hypothetical protein
MRRALFAVLAVPAVVAGCGHSSGPSGLTVTCNGQTALVGASQVTVQLDPASKTTLLTFPDPVNEGHTGTIPVDRRCTIAPTTQ